MKPKQAGCNPGQSWCTPPCRNSHLLAIGREHESSLNIVGVVLVLSGPSGFCKPSTCSVLVPKLTLVERGAAALPAGLVSVLASRIRKLERRSSLSGTMKQFSSPSGLFSFFPNAARHSLPGTERALMEQTPAFQNAQKTILVVDDDADVLKFVSRLPVDSNYNVTMPAARVCVAENHDVPESHGPGCADGTLVAVRETGGSILPVAPCGGDSVAQGKRWGVILAGGDGTRLRRLTRLACGDDRPKQFCPLIGDDTLLEQTRIRAERSVPAERILFPLTRTHRDFYLREQGIRPSQRIVQPMNKGTAPPIIYSLLSIEQNDNGAMVAILPCDHHYSDERAFTAALESAFDVAARHRGSVMLLGALPRGPQTEYGWIELGPSSGGADSASFHVRRFCEKPSFHVARQLLERGALWNTFVMVGHVRGFLEMVKAARPGLIEAI